LTGSTWALEGAETKERNLMAEADLTNLLPGLTNAAERLNRASDTANAIISSVEARLVSANIGIEVWLSDALNSTDTVEPNPGEMSWISQFLGFAKVNGSWCLAVKSTRFVSGFFEGNTACPYQQEFLAAAPTPLSQAPRAVRIAALEYLPKLVERLIAEATRYAESIERVQAVN
jgi:hypothetical protein